MDRIKLFIIVGILLLPFKAFAMNGATYPIIEPDMLAQIQAGARKIESHPAKLRKMFKKKLYNYVPTHTYLPVAGKSYTFYHDVIYKLSFSIPKVQGGKIVGTLYPKGFTFHVLRYLPFDFPTLVIFSMKNKYERFYVSRKYGYDKNPEAMLLTTSGNLKDILKMAKRIKKPVYANIGKLDERFGVKNTISIVKRSVIRLDDVKIKVIGMKYLINYYEKHKSE
ncbi:MAG: hypothetical protein ACYCS0_01275 [bacterium]